jgi:extradiol dioxygenase family protein
MSIFLGNIQFNQIREHLGYQLREDDKLIWEQYHNNSADLSCKESSFHVFDIPKCIQFKGEAAKQAILTMFTPDKLVESKGRFKVYEKS